MLLPTKQGRQISLIGPISAFYLKSLISFSAILFWFSFVPTERTKFLGEQTGLSVFLCKRSVTLAYSVFSVHSATVFPFVLQYKKREDDTEKEKKEKALKYLHGLFV